MRDQKASMSLAYDGFCETYHPDVKKVTDSYLAMHDLIENAMKDLSAWIKAAKYRGQPYS